MARTRADDLLLGEWACLGLLAERPTHGYDVALRLAPEGDVGRVWSLSRPLTYRALDQLVQRRLARPIAEERGLAGGTRTVLAPSGAGRTRLARWLAAPVPHFRDMRSEFLVKLVLCDLLATDRAPLVEAQYAVLAPMVDALKAGGGPRHDRDPVAVWRYESSRAVMRFLERLGASPSRRRTSR